MSARTITSKDMLRFQTCERLLGYNQLTPELRYEQARVAQQLRNFFFTATLLPRVPAEPINKQLIARTSAFSDALVLTDLISLADFDQAESDTRLLEVLEHGGEERSLGLNFFGLSEYVPQRYILKHEKNRSTAVGTGIPPVDFDLQGRHIAYVPRLLAPFQRLTFEWANNNGLVSRTEKFFLQAGLRAVRTLKPDNPHSYFSPSTDRDIKNYIARSRPETFLLEALLPVAQRPAVGVTVRMVTPQMERPLLVFGATSNVEGVQASLMDETKQYIFTSPDVPLNSPSANALTYKDVPLALWACNSDFRNYNLYNMWAIPHLLERGSRFVINLTSGLTPDTNNTFQETIKTRNNEQDVRITFICRTV